MNERKFDSFGASGQDRGCRNCVRASRSRYLRTVAETERHPPNHSLAPLGGKLAELCSLDVYCLFKFAHISMDSPK